MSRLIEPGDGPAIGLDECIDLIAAQRIEPGDEDGLAALAPILARLARNYMFLGDAAISALSGDGDNAGYDAQTLALGKIGDRYLLRAGFWPSPGDPAYVESGPGAFCYGMPHDHDFSFLTCGYLGPGYMSDEWEVSESPPEDGPVGLRPMGRSRLTPGRVVLYRAHRDVHSQLPPERFSVSLNLIDRAVPAARRPQYRYDPSNDRISGTLTTAPAEILLDLATRLGGGDGIDLAIRFARRHPSPRMRMTALSALRQAAPQALPPLLADAIAARDVPLSRHARPIATDMDGIARDDDA